MSSVKDKHYWTQLRTALTGGLWDSSCPGKAPNGATLSWSELLRKFNKHCHGYSDVAELASQTQALSLLLAANNKDGSMDGNELSSGGQLELGDECLLPDERVSEGTEGYNALKGLIGSNSDSIGLAVAYYAYALGHPSECLSLLNQTKDLTNVQSRIPNTGTIRSNSSTLQVPGSGADSSSSSWTGSFVTSTSSVTSIPDITDGRAWATTECIRSACLKGMAHERIVPTDRQSALEAYLSVLPLVKTVSTEIPCSPPLKASNANDYATFSRYRELWRWVERLLRRAIVISAGMCDLSNTKEEEESIWNLFEYYRACGAHWPPNFRPEYRSTVLTIHLRALILRAPSPLKPPRWISGARSIIQEFRGILSVSTHFPRAGERNTRVEDFVDLCVAVWEADGAIGEYAGWVLDVLWWATRSTFNSFRVFRHMTRILSESGDSELAKRTLRLYVQVVSKAREAATAESNQHDSSGLEEDPDFDTDRNWVTALIHGARMLCRSALVLSETNYAKALDDAKEAGVMIERAKHRLDKEDMELVASVELAEAIWSSVMAHTEQDPFTRTTRLSHTLSLLQCAVGTYPSPSIYHHLALALARPGPSQNLQDAIVHARSAVEGDPSEVRHWHLLGLLLAATGDWTAARGVLEFGVEAGEGDADDDDHDPMESQRSPGLNIKDFATSEPKVNGTNRTTVMNGADSSTASFIIGSVIDPEATEIPPSASLLQSYVDRPPSSGYDRFEYVLQTRMTQLALTEFVEGAEGVGEKWLEVFQWFREKRGVNVDDRRMSIDSRRVSVSEDARPLSEIASIQEPAPSNAIRIETSETQNQNGNGNLDVLPTPIPITVTPASPGILTPTFQSPESSALGVELNGSVNSSHEKRSTSLDEKDREVSAKGKKKVKEALKTSVHKGQARISTISKKIGHGVGRRGSLSLKRTSSTPDFHSVLSQTPYQASSIHLRHYQSVLASQQDLGLLEVPPPPPSPTPVPTDGQKKNARNTKDRRLLSDLWLMSAAIFRRLGKIEQAKGAIQEAEVRDEDNPAVWVQLGLYYTALSNQRRAIESFQKALFISPNDISATVHLCRLYLTPLSEATASSSTAREIHPDTDHVDLAAGLLSDLTQGAGWDVPEAWYFLAKAYKLQGRRDRERECLSFALALSETRGVRDIGKAVGWCL
ncbi:hypothetical protein C8Q75DRAFT_802874 [Abortiporus biennis]|nr:hypothetical protein C8Q75DRAFT_802874 [Abortiporus biennis]